uniref:Uncharacterized protein n=1 Tax=Parascaris equorum TaxID=6256 RepID=A0A914S0T4_PAREQ
MIVKTMDNVALALMVCCQKLSPDSSWLPYLDALPQTFSTPLYFSALELRKLSPSPAYEESLIMYRNVARQFVYFLAAVQRSEKSPSAKKVSFLFSRGTCDFSFILSFHIACLSLDY